MRSFPSTSSPLCRSADFALQKAIALGLSDLAENHPPLHFFLECREHNNLDDA